MQFGLYLRPPSCSRTVLQPQLRNSIKEVAPILRCVCFTLIWLNLTCKTHFSFTWSLLATFYFLTWGGGEYICNTVGGEAVTYIKSKLVCNNLDIFRCAFQSILILRIKFLDDNEKYMGFIWHQYLYYYRLNHGDEALMGNPTLINKNQK